MAYDEGYEGFVPITVVLPEKRIEGMAWKKGGRRLLQHIEQEKRAFIPIVDAQFSGTSAGGTSGKTIPVIAVNLAAITAIIPGDAVRAIEAESEREVAASET